MSLIFEEKQEPTAEDIEAIFASLVTSEVAAGRQATYLPYSVLLRDTADGPIIGGLYGAAIFEWLFIQYVAVPLDRQGEGIGRQLMAKAENWAREQGLGGIWLDTFSFQARPFYEKLGFSVFGEIPEHPRGDTRYFLKKPL
ncbi:GNAT family N-acetyltransferase [Devosia sp.]|uniref:GNAT family N-acetyltransferase n=1 Tax=Devosia sp. TaxID=1871048 RepID=UPI003A95198F